MSGEATPSDPGPDGVAVDNSWIGELLVAAIVIYFARSAVPMLDYYERLGVGARMWETADGLLEAGLALVLSWNGKALGFLTVAIPLLIYLTRNRKGFEVAGLGFVALGPLGWYVGSSFAEAYARQAACNSQSFLGLGCMLDGEPFLSFLLFSLIVVCSGAITALMLVGLALEKLSGGVT
ncbi:hypothetical protein [Rhizobium sp. CECT 9324]|uniref:hypothetical protein n=1 Tax=Rhizobium sp. CECT 9324 TaxID=2845820 RepID=UPI001E45E4DB|nr:hypothetical protein [Rhizobium sp. CECT 9324]CAH0343060.1 hypothetical protein RHI9324_04793 [Rhizobium sp. CECT 9324]